MIIIIKSHTPMEKIQRLASEMEARALKIHLSIGEHTTIMGLVGDTSVVDLEDIKAIDIVADVKRVQEPFKKANRKFHQDDTVVDVAGVKVGGGHFGLMAGPCSVETREQIISVARDVQKSGANMLRGGAFKPRTSPYAFQGLEAEGLELLRVARAETGLPIVSEVMSEADLPLFDDVDLIQIGARNMQNFRLLKAVGERKNPVLLKRGLANTIEEWLMSAEYIMAGGNENVILCERGVRTFETATRNTLDLSAVPVLKRLTHLPVVIDPSHAGGAAYLVPALSKAAIAAGADGLMIEVHNCPPKALSDGAQSITPAEFDALMGQLRAYLALEGKQLS